jgi:hypothetical protein
MIIKIKGYYAPEKREIIARLSELSLDQLHALDAQLSAAGEQPPADLVH